MLNLVLWLGRADLSKKASQPPLTFPSLSVKTMQEVSCTTAHFYFHPNGIQTEPFTKKISPIQSTTSVLLLPTRALFIFWEAGSEFSHTSYAHERFVFRCCFFRCCSTMALPKPQTDQFSWSVVQLMSWDINFLGTVQMQFPFYHDDTDPRAEQLLNNQSSRSEERPTSPR